MDRMADDRSLRIIRDCTPTEKRRRGRPRKKIPDTSESYGNSATSTSQTSFKATTMTFVAGPVQNSKLFNFKEILAGVFVD